jgi:hypothetical protein
MTKVLLVPVSCQTLSPLCREIHEAVLGALTENGQEVVVAESPRDFQDVRQLLMLGVGEWGPGQHGELLRAAGEKGIHRVFWQLETLPPPDLPHSWVVEFLLARAPDRTRGLRRLVERIAYSHLGRLCTGLWWSRDGAFESRRFALPFREARKLIAMWKQGLIDHIVVSQEARQQFLANRSIPSTFVPLGYHPVWGQVLPDVERDLDVVFLGTRYSRRAGLLAEIETKLAAHGYGVTIVDKACFGAERTRLLNRAKILLFLRNYPWELPRLRLLMAMGCGAMVVTEDFPYTRPFVPGEHFAMASPEALSDTLLHYLNDERDRRRLAERARDLLQGEVRAGDAMAKALARPAG